MTLSNKIILIQINKNFDFRSGLEESAPVLLPSAHTSDAADKEVDSAEKKEERGIFQDPEKVEEVPNIWTSRLGQKLCLSNDHAKK